jgi:hypothetical protein
MSGELHGTGDCGGYGGICGEPAVKRTNFEGDDNRDCGVTAVSVGNPR